MLWEAVAEAKNLYESWSKRFPDWVRAVPMLRPLKGEAGERLKRSYERAKEAGELGFVEMNLEDQKEAQTAFPELAHEGGILSYSPGFSVALGDVMARLAEEQVSRGIRSHGKIVRLERKNGSWTAYSATETWTANHIIFASGASLQEWFPRLSGQIEGGHLLRVLENPIQAMVSRGDIHLCPSAEGAVLGATRWAEGQPAPEPKEAAEDLRLRGESLVKASLTAGALWEGKRLVSGGDRLPWVGSIPGVEGASLIGGLGSKGLLYAPLAVTRLVGWLQEAQALPHEMRTDCFAPRFWEFQGMPGPLHP